MERCKYCNKKYILINGTKYCFSYNCSLRESQVLPQQNEIINEKNAL